ncbi:hypothetical protein QN277_011386 [Acacia crassicarpa]|uniref:Uncharacterized protein n=1 Tax=Acacia crassicarpa TaxID=499986 RepID=A0AAE1MYU4_9FABA|nr:hypothetical protein QN277_011386 [Acacia crassicarpa]
MTVQEYTDKFIELSRFASNLIPMGKEKARKYAKGLTFKIQKSLGGIPSKTFQEAYERALNIFDILQTEEEVLERNKRKQFGSGPQQASGDNKPRYDNKDNNWGGKQPQG